MINNITKAMRFNKLSAFFALSLILISLPLIGYAAEFDPSNLISDAEISDFNSMTLPEIQNFLNNRNGTLDNYLTFDKEGLPKTAVQSFFEISQRWQINPKYLMVLTQKEQSLLEDSSPSQKQYDWATGYGICDNCSMGDPSLERFKGFYRQVNSAAAQTRYYMDNIGEFNFQPNKTYNIDGTSVTLKNTATAGLYNYTPHLHGNQNLVNLWNKYFSMKWPNGTLLTTSGSSSDVFLIQNGFKRLIASKSVLVSLFDPKYIITASVNDINSYQDGPPVKYLNFSILKSDATGNLYMIVNDTKRKIESMEVFKKLGLPEDDIQTVSEADLKLYIDGSDITAYTVYPTGIILQDTAAKKPYQGMYYVISGEKKPILTKEIFDANYSGMKVKKVTTAILDNYMTGGNIVLPDGWLVKSKTPIKYKTVTTIVKKKKVVTKVIANPEVTAVYVISSGKKLPFMSGAALSSMGYNTKNIKLISDETLNLIPNGNLLTGN
ncbi:MAG: hypothetical protein WCT26_05095 [Candidatus Buchananbacteria bacterium]|jgi:hypothetical protein